MLDEHETFARERGDTGFNVRVAHGGASAFDNRVTKQAPALAFKKIQSARDWWRPRNLNFSGHSGLRLVTIGGPDFERRAVTEFTVQLLLVESRRPRARGGLEVVESSSVAAVVGAVLPLVGLVSRCCRTMRPD